MEREISNQRGSSLQPHSQVTSSASASSDQSLGRVPRTAVNDGSTNSAAALANDSQAVEMDVFVDEPQPFHAQYSTELK